MSAFSVIAPLYDRINGDQYKRYVTFLQSAFQQADIPVREVLDVGCGTGRITGLLADMGYDMVGIDNSSEMLNLAYFTNRRKNTLLLFQDMRHMDLHGTVQAAYCAFDVLNYVKSVQDVRQVFRSVHLFLEPGGVFVFDVNTRERLNRYRANTYTYEFKNGLLLWRNESAGVGTRFVLDWFAGEDGGPYGRFTEQQVEYPHARRTLLELAKETGFSVLSVFNTPEECPIPTEIQASAGDAKQFYVLKRI